jgi:hypothetical protein
MKCFVWSLLFVLFNSIWCEEGKAVKKYSPFLLSVHYDKLLALNGSLGFIFADPEDKYPEGYALQVGAGMTAARADFGFAIKESKFSVLTGISYVRLYSDPFCVDYVGVNGQIAPGIFFLSLGWYLPVTGDTNKEHLNYLWNAGIGFSIF